MPRFPVALAFWVIGSGAVARAARARNVIGKRGICVSTVSGLCAPTVVNLSMPPSAPGDFRITRETDVRTRKRSRRK